MKIAQRAKISVPRGHWTIGIQDATGVSILGPEPQEEAVRIEFTDREGRVSRYMFPTLSEFLYFLEGMPQPEPNLHHDDKEMTVMTQFTLADPLPYFLHTDHVLYLGTENALVFSIPLSFLVSYAPEAATELERATQDAPTHEIEAIDVKDLEQQRREPHPLAPVIECLHLGEQRARDQLAASVPFTTANEQLRIALDNFADFCDVASEELANNVPLERIRVLPWPRVIEADVAVEEG